jgi:hypothetical protein
MALPRPSSLLDQGMDTSRHYYWRQLRDMKGSAEVDSMAPVASTATRDLRPDPRVGCACGTQIQPKGMTAGFCCVVGDARHTL